MLFLSLRRLSRLRGNDGWVHCKGSSFDFLTCFFFAGMTLRASGYRTWYFRSSSLAIWFRCTSSGPSAMRSVRIDA